MRIVDFIVLPEGRGTVICFDRKLSYQEQALQTLIIGDITISVSWVHNDHWMFTKEEIPDYESLIGKEAVLQ